MRERERDRERQREKKEKIMHAHPKDLGAHKHLKDRMVLLISFLGKVLVWRLRLGKGKCGNLSSVSKPS